jgi:Uma2 family endonuclease
LASTQIKMMTADEFLVWCLDQDEKYELVDGIPVLLHGEPLNGQSGASADHDIIVVNIIVALGTRLQGKPCRPSTSDLAVRTSIKKIRRPDVTVECGPGGRQTYESRNPLAVFEVLSPSTRQTDMLIKIEEYKRHPTIQTVVIVEQDIMDVLVCHRDQGWDPVPLKAPGDVVRLPGADAALTLSEIYRGVTLGA